MIRFRFRERAIMARATIVCAAIAFSLLFGSQSAISQPFLTFKIPPTLEIAGLYWGQSEADARRQLARAGFEIVDEFGGSPNFAEEVQETVENRRRGANLPNARRTKRIETRKGAERINLTIRAIPQGAIVWSVEYSDESRSGRTLAAAKEKYTPRTQHSYVFRDWGIFCQNLERARCDHYGDHIRFSDGEPTLPYIWASTDSLKLDPASRAEDYYEAAFDYAVSAELKKTSLSF